MIDRRTLIASLALGTLAMARASSAQPAGKVFKIGILALIEPSDLVGPQPRSRVHDSLLIGLRELGYVYGEHFVTEARGAAGKPERFPDLAAELVRLRVDVIVAASPALPALRRATSTVPIVMAGATDPLGQGFVQSLGRPGGNFTGLSRQAVDVTAKRLSLLKELVSTMTPVAVVWDQASRLDWQAAETAARERGWRLVSLEIRDPEELEGALRTAIDARAGALLVLAPGLLFTRAQRVVTLAAKSRLPAMYELRQYVEAGGLISYSPDLDHIWRRAAAFVDKILKGAKPAELPIEQPTKFELVINLKAAQSIGLTIPQSILLRADEVIQ